MLRLKTRKALLEGAEMCDKVALIAKECVRYSTINDAQWLASFLRFQVQAEANNEANQEADEASLVLKQMFYTQLELMCSEFVAQAKVDLGK